MDIPSLDPQWVTVFVTIVLVGITGFYAWEVKKTRVERVKPSFSLRTGLYTIGGGIHALYLINRGGVAKDVYIDIFLDEKEFKKFYVPSLSVGEEVNLEIDPDSEKKKKSKMKIQLKFKDGYKNNLTDSLIFDIKGIEKEGYTIQFQSLSLNKNLKEISRNMERIARSVDDTKSAVKDLKNIKFNVKM